MSVQHTSLQPYFLQANEGEAIWYTAARMTLKATSESTGGALSLVEVLAPPDFAAPWHVHRRDDEMFYILDRSFLFKCGDKLFEGGPGAFGFLPRDIPHSFKNVGETLAKFLVLGTPAGLQPVLSWMPGRPLWRRGCVHSPSIFSRWQPSRPNTGWQFWGHRLSKRRAKRLVPLQISLEE